MRRNGGPYPPHDPASTAGARAPRKGRDQAGLYKWLVALPPTSTGSVRRRNGTCRYGAFLLVGAAVRLNPWRIAVISTRRAPGACSRSMGDLVRPTVRPIF